MTTASAIAPSPVQKAPASAEIIRSGIPQVRAAAQVGSTSLITVQEVMEQVNLQIRDFSTLSRVEREQKQKEIYHEELGKLIERELLIDDMTTRLKKSKASIDDIKEDAAKMADDRIRMIRKAHGFRSEDELAQALGREDVTIAGFRRSLERQMLADQYVMSMLKEMGNTRPPGFAEVRAYYDRHSDQFMIQDKVRYQDVFVSFNKYPEAAHAHAEQVWRAAIGGVDFVSLIKVEEGNPKGRHNWDGIGTTRDEVPPDVSPTLFEMKPGEISQPIATPAGYHVVKVVERQYAGIRPFDEKVQMECIEKLKKQFNDREYRKMIEDLWRKGTIQVFEAP